MNQNEMKQPFFVQFLESQNQDAHNAVTSPSQELRQTLKYPSDRDEEWDAA